MAADARERLREAAAEWHERLADDSASPQLRSVFERWLGASPEHAQAYSEVERAWKLLRASAAEPAILALRQEAALRATRATSTRVQRLRRAAVAAALLVALGAAALVPWLSRDGSTSTARIRATGDAHTYSTHRGEQLAVTLADGSRVTLDTQSELRVAYAANERALSLTRGQAMFEVAKDAARPFVVSAGDRRYVAVGTAFNVRVAPDAVRITMVEGTVRVEHVAGEGGGAMRAVGAEATMRDGAARLAPTTIRAGDQLVSDMAHGDRLYSADATQVTSWLHGDLVFDDLTLADAIAEFNRYGAVGIELSDPRLGEVRLSGTFSVSRPERFVEAVTSYFPITATAGPGGAVVLSPR